MMPWQKLKETCRVENYLLRWWNFFTVSIYLLLCYYWTLFFLPFNNFHKMKSLENNLPFSSVLSVGFNYNTDEHLPLNAMMGRVGVILIFPDREETSCWYYCEEEEGDERSFNYFYLNMQKISEANMIRRRLERKMLYSIPTGKMTASSLAWWWERVEKLFQLCHEQYGKRR